MRLIDADALMPLFVKKANTMKDRHGVKLGDEWLLSYNDIKDVIDNAPTVERPTRALARLDDNGEVKIELLRPQGEWITKDHSIDYYCSHCGERLDQCCENFCCHCGADMRKEAENE